MMGSLPVFVFQLLLILFASHAEANNERTVYLVHMKGGSHGRYESSSGHQALLSQILDEDSTVAEALIYSYKESFTGFAARLTETEQQKLQRRREVLAVSPSREYQLHTTRSWDYLNLSINADREVNIESNMVVGVLDTGIWPYSNVFSDDGMSPAPSGWENKCENDACNKKIIGARSYYSGKRTLAEEKSVIDINGHGTHTASIIAGRETKDASFYGLAEGTLRGGVPNARLAIYKVCWRVYKNSTEPTVVITCPDCDILKAIDDAIEDKVDIISASLGASFGSDLVQLDEDCVALAFLKAFNKGILTSASAGNNGTAGWYKVTNGQPWILTVAASEMDRKFWTSLELEEGKDFTANTTINPFETQDSFYPLAQQKFKHSALRRELIANRGGFPLYDYVNDEGKDVFFNFSNDNVNKALEEKANGLIVIVNTTAEQPPQFPLASVCLTMQQEKTLRAYTKTNRNPSAKIHKTRDEIIPDPNGPRAAAFSSKGPNPDPVFANILKPDIAAPGLKILAGWSEEAKLSKYPNDNRSSIFNIESGTSMACPHATAMALYVKTHHPSWSPAMIKSALMTTAKRMNRNVNKPYFELGYGAGHLNATAVLNPGLVYDTREDDYITFLCRQGYSIEKLKWIFGRDSISCSETERNCTVDDLNYPTMSARVDINCDFSLVFHRTVTNVGPADSTYKVDIKSPKKFVVTVNPDRLQFSSSYEKREFLVKVTGRSAPNGKSGEKFVMQETWINWTNGEHNVRSPIVIYSIPKK